VSARWAAGRQRLVIVSGPGLVEADRVAVSRQDLPADAAGLLSAGGDRRIGVRVYTLPELPPGVVTIGADLAAEHGLGDGDVSWSLATAEAATAAQLTLEPMTDGSMHEVGRVVLGAADLAGRVIFIDATESAWLTVGTIPLRVRGATDAAGRPLDGLVRVGRDTQLMLYGQSGRAGVDIVVLADCSGSMSLADVPQVQGEDPYGWRLGHGSAGGTIERCEAQKRALLRLLDARLGTSGRPSRVALVRFTTSCEVLFPVNAGMAEMSADSEPAVADAFRRAVTLMRPLNANTDIGGALHFASELLHRHGVPGNDQLVVLVSDGADFNPKGEEATGEAVAATTDAVSLMDELYQSANIRLHAIGISDEAAFQRWWARERGGSFERWMVPDHRLLADLVRVGGGDPSRIGGLDVLEDYFGGLGGGVTTRIGVPAPARHQPRVQPDLAAVVQRQLGVDAPARAAFAQTAEEIRRLYAECLQIAGDRADLRLLRQPRHVDQFRDLGAVAQSRTELKGWLGLLDGIFENRPQGLAEGLQSLAGDRRLLGLRQVRDDDRSPLAEDDVQGWFAVQTQLAASLHALLTDIRTALTAAPRTGAPAADAFGEDWYQDNFT
jgi:hypothetical protein